jgi:hypothetical protein
VGELMPFNGFENFDACVLAMQDKGHSEEEAREICGAMERDAQTSRMRLRAMALELPEVEGHPNRAPFSGVLTMLDVPSDAAPEGAGGHLVMLPSEVAERALGGLLGMGVNFEPGMRGHDTRRKIGVITAAEVVGRELRVSGHLFAKDFPDVVREIRARRGAMGMSYEISNVEVEDPEAEVWVLDKFVFTGAAILEKDAAAFKQTSLAAAGKNKEEAMEKQEVQKTVMESIREFFASLGKKPGGEAGFSEAEVKRIAAEAASSAAGAVETKLTAQITALGEENKQLKQAAAARSVEARRARWNGAVKAASEKGRLVPALLATLAAQAELAIAATAKVKVMEAQADKTTKEVEVDPLDSLIAHVEALPQIVPLGELATGRARHKGKTIQFTPSKGVELDMGSVALNARAEEIAAERKIPFGEALRAARAEGAGTEPGGMAAGAV